MSKPLQEEGRATPEIPERNVIRSNAHLFSLMRFGYSAVRNDLCSVDFVCGHVCHLVTLRKATLMRQDIGKFTSQVTTKRHPFLRRSSKKGSIQWPGVEL